MSLPQTSPADVRALLGSAAEITDEQPQTITRYRPKICYSIAGEGGRTYAKLRLHSHTMTDNPAWYAAQTAATNRLTDEQYVELTELVAASYAPALAQ